MTGAVVEVQRLSKEFRGVVALSDVSLEIGPGVTSLLGPNGAGKSTLLRVLCGLTEPSRGSVRVLGRRPRHDVSLYRALGLVPQQQALPDRLTARDFVRLAARLHGVREVEEAASAALELVELDPADRRPLRAYSRGMRQRVKLAQAVVHQPQVVVLDEPLDGLDPRQRRRALALFRRLGDEGRTVLVSSHVLEEVAQLGSRVVVLVAGRLAAEGDFHAIRDLMDDRPHRIRVGTDRPRALAGALLAEGGVVAARIDGHGVVVDADDPGRFRRSLAAVARRQEARLTEVVPLDEDLDSVFRYLLERRR